jgi:hypothetical protein
VIHLNTAAINLFNFFKFKSVVIFWQTINGVQLYKTSGCGLCGQLTEMLLTTTEEKSADKSIQLLVFFSQ